MKLILTLSILMLPIAVNLVTDAASKFDVTKTSIYEWQRQRADKRRNINGNGNESPIKDDC